MPVTTLIQQLVQATLPQTQSLLPNDLKASVRVLTIVIEILENNYNGSDINEVNVNNYHPALMAMIFITSGN